MFKWKNLLTDNHLPINPWGKKLDAGKKSWRFLYLFTPMMEHIFLQLKTACSQSVQLGHLLDDKFLRNCILNDFVDNVHPLIVRVAVLEMHLLGREKLLKGQTSEQRFKYFVELLADPDNALDLLSKYPLLALHVQNYADQFIDIFLEFLQRFDQDYKGLLEFVFNQEITAEKVRLVELNITGDRHLHGHAVMVLKLQQGNLKRKVVYKPRNLSVDVAFQTLINWHNQYAKIPLLQTRILARNHYGWCEFLENQSCQTQDQLSRFYYREGALLMLIHLLHGYDIHLDNIIACGEYPVIVDYECLLAPRFHQRGINDESEIRHLVADAHFLPAKFKIDRKHKGADISALSAASEEEGYSYEILWMDEGLDTMHAVRERFKFSSSAHLPHLQNQAVNFLEYIQDFLQGFSDTHGLLCRQRDFLLGAESVLRHFQKAWVRVLIRPTSFYWDLLAESTHPRFLNSIRERNQFWCRSFRLQPAVRIQSSGALRAELYDLKRGNIPIFYMQAGANILLDSQGNPLNFRVVKSGYDIMLDYVRNELNEQDLAIQVRIIRHSFNAAQMNQTDNVNSQVMPEPASTMLKFSESPANELTSLAVSLAQRELNQLINEAIQFEDQVFWSIIDYNEKLDLWSATLTGVDLYNGLPGIILPFAYAGKLLAIPQYTQWARLCVESLWRTLKIRHITSIKTIGAFTGVSGLLYLFTVLYKLWQDDELLLSIQRLLTRLGTLIKKNTALDIIDGDAGCILVLLSMQNILPQLDLLPYAKLCVQHLLTAYPDPQKLPRAERTFATQALLGFSHGVAGMAFALSYYDQFNQDPKVRAWIQAALDYERQNFNVAKNNWPDFRKSEGEVADDGPAMVAWCHGAAGVGLARLGMQPYWQDPYLKTEIDTAIKTTLAEGLDHFHCLCHGSLGNLELLLNASLQFKDLELKKQYEYHATRLLNKIAGNDYRCSFGDNSAAVGLMLGRAGVVYQMLRMTYPTQVPSVLLLQL